MSTIDFVGVRPDGVTAEDVARWEEHRLKEPLAMGDLDPAMIELFYAGEWLDEELRQLGASDDEVKGLCFELGQRAWPRCAGLWSVAVRLLESFKAGRGPQPGRVTGQEVLGEWVRAKR